nr:hypothetical protein CFP56_23633 [Quercus suber]
MSLGYNGRTVQGFFIRDPTTRLALGALLNPSRGESRTIIKEAYIQSKWGLVTESHKEKNPLPSLNRHMKQVPRESSKFVRIPWDSGRCGNT